ncbi:hypothetical protein BCR44DRAFT_1436257 [Catenaria anguillulae PL171]|uniref:Uncharacterized protein n=1 Tax=Catenaria anguillulae PL171 TaxID=765915 RepID=A0A1Y2HKS4_9FUNG|nr:hypothetical protein BCR44DRAFT_1436257 [Catenaria anguillulae PL171]
MPRKPKSQSRSRSPSPSPSPSPSQAATSAPKGKSSAVDYSADPVFDPASDPELDSFNEALKTMDGYNLSGKIKTPRPKTWPIQFQWVKLGFALLLTYYATTIVIPPPSAQPSDHVHAKSKHKDAYVGDHALAFLTMYGGTGGLLLLLAAFVVPLHLFTSPAASSLAAQCPPLVHHLATLLTRVRAIVIGYHHKLVSPLYQPLHANEFLATMICLGGVALRKWAFRTLNDKFTYTVRIFDDHELIASGPYKKLCIRFVGMMVAHLVPLYFRIVNEEMALAEHFGADKWDAHVRGRYRLVPYVW